MAIWRRRGRGAVGERRAATSSRHASLPLTVIIASALFLAGPLSPSLFDLQTSARVVMPTPPSSSTRAPPARKPSSSSIIAALQRASFGIATLPPTSSTGGDRLTDADIAELIAKEAREKEKVWREHGLGAYRSTCVPPLPPRSSGVAPFFRLRVADPDPLASLPVRFQPLRPSPS